MTSKLVLGLVSAGLAMTMIAPAMAQGDRGASDRGWTYSGEPDRNGRDDRSSDRGRQGNDRYDGDRRPDQRVRTLSVPTRYRATILLTETVTRDGRRSNNVCYAETRGPEARFVLRRDVSRVARKHCSRNARIILR